MRLIIDMDGITVNLEMEGLPVEIESKVAKYINSTVAKAIKEKHSQTVETGNKAETGAAKQQKTGLDAAENGPQTSETDDTVGNPPINTLKTALAEAYENAAADIEAGKWERRQEKEEPRNHPLDLPEELQEEIGLLLASGANSYNYKISDNKRAVLFQCYYKCPNCTNKGKHFIPKDQKIVTCHSCSTKMDVKPSEIVGEFPTVDDFGNVFVAGTFRRKGEVYAAY